MLAYCREVVCDETRSDVSPTTNVKFNLTYPNASVFVTFQTTVVGPVVNLFYELRPENS